MEPARASRYNINDKKHFIIWRIPISDDNSCPNYACTHSKPLIKINRKCFWFREHGCGQLMSSKLHYCEECSFFFMTQKDFEAFHLRIQKMHHGRYFVHFLKINAKHTIKDIYLASQKLDCDLFTDDSYRNIKARFDDPNYCIFSPSIFHDSIALSQIACSWFPGRDFSFCHDNCNDILKRVNSEMEKHPHKSQYRKFMNEMYSYGIMLMYEASKGIKLNTAFFEAVSSFVSFFLQDISVLKEDFQELCFQICLILRCNNRIISFRDFKSKVISVLLDSDLFQRIIHPVYSLYCRNYKNLEYYMYLFIQDNDCSYHEYIISNEYSFEQSEKNECVVSLSSQTALNLMKRIRLYKNGSDNSCLMYRIHPDEDNFVPAFLYIRSNGGFYSVDTQIENVKLLLYSPFYDKFIPINASYHKVKGVCFISMKIFKDFIRDYGNPGIELYSWNKFKSSYYIRAESSFYREWGYNAASDQNELSDSARQSILSIIMDLELRKPEKIIGYLEDCIRMHPMDKDCYAREKWSHDIEFVKNYKVNPSRFLIMPDYIKNRKHINFK